VLEDVVAAPQSADIEQQRCKIERNFC
jgi:hypothetical protein